MRCVPKKIIVPMDELNQRDGEGSYFKVWDDVDPFFTHPVEDVAYIPESLHTALCEEQVRAAAQKAYAAGHRAAMSQFTTHGTDGCKSCETGRVTMFIANQECIRCDPEGYETKPLEASRAKPEQGGGENGV